MTYSLEELNEAKSKCIVTLMTKPDASFFTTLTLSMKYIWDASINTACTDGTSIRFNPDFFMSQTLEQQVGLLVHEASHVAYLHSERLMGRNHKKFNIAADHVINLMLLERGFQLPAGGWHDAQYRGMSSEQVYDLMPDPPESPADKFLDLREPTEETPEEVRAEVEEILVRAAIQSKLDGDKAGTIPGEIQIFLDGLLKPKLPWTMILFRYLKALTRSDYSFRKPNRRYFPTHYLPTLYSEKVIDLTICVDASASVADKEFHQFVSEIASTFKMMKPDNITLVQFDYGIRSINKIKSIRDLMNCEFHGRGGTDISEIVQHVNKTKPQLTLVFTDGDFRFYNDQMKHDVIWLIHNNKGFTAPYGKVIHYQI